MLSRVQYARKKISDQIEFFPAFLQGIDLQISPMFWIQVRVEMPMIAHLDAAALTLTASLRAASEKIDRFTPRVMNVNVNVFYSSVRISIRALWVFAKGFSHEVSCARMFLASASPFLPLTPASPASCLSSFCVGEKDIRVQGKVLYRVQGTKVSRQMIR